MANAKYSRYDACDALFIDCVECTEGPNGSCDCDDGWNNDRPRDGGCFCGTLLEGLTVVKVE